MYIYSIYENKGSLLTLYLLHDKEFAQEEFERICKESSGPENGGSPISYVYVNLKNNYGFKDIGDFIVGDYECIKNSNKLI